MGRRFVASHVVLLVLLLALGALAQCSHCAGEHAAGKGHVLVERDEHASAQYLPVDELEESEAQVAEDEPRRVVEEINPDMTLEERLALRQRMGSTPRDKYEEYVPTSALLPKMIDIPAGEFTMGTDQPVFPQDGEGPARKVKVGAFRMMETTVTNKAYKAYLDASGHVPTATLQDWSFAFQPLVSKAVDLAAKQSVAGAPWWIKVHGATWDHPEGPDSSVKMRQDHPVVHVSYEDAREFCAHFRMRLPTEAEWEYAARGGLENKLFPWGDELLVNGEHQANIWQGEFPVKNTAEDGYVGTAPAKSFKPNGFGLYNMIGNVWEWTSSDFDEHDKVTRGGSFLCHKSYCYRYRNAARSHNSPDSTAANLGFRCVEDEHMHDEL